MNMVVLEHTWLSVAVIVQNAVCLYSFLNRMEHDTSSTSNVCFIVYVRKLLRCMTFIFRRQFSVNVENRVLELSACSTNSCLCKLGKITFYASCLYAKWGYTKHPPLFFHL